jgi:hypothetical protein
MEQTVTSQPIQNKESVHNEKSPTYQVKNMTFIVEPVFRSEGNPLGNILLKMMKDDVESENPANRRRDSGD